MGRIAILAFAALLAVGNIQMAAAGKDDLRGVRTGMTYEEVMAFWSKEGCSIWQEEYQPHRPRAYVGKAGCRFSDGSDLYIYPALSLPDNPIYRVELFFQTVYSLDELSAWITSEFGVTPSGGPLFQQLGEAELPNGTFLVFTVSSNNFILRIEDRTLLLEDARRAEENLKAGKPLPKL